MSNTLSGNLKLTAAETAAVFPGLRPETLIQWAYRGLISPTAFIGRRPLFLVADVKRLFDERRSLFRAKH